MLAFFNNQSVKDKLVAQVMAHQLADEIAQGMYVGENDGKLQYCCVGCCVHSSNHRLFETMYGIPAEVAIYADIIHERLSQEDMKLWPAQFVTGVVVGSDLSLVEPKLIHRILTDDKYGILLSWKDEKTKPILVDFVGLYEKWIATGIRPNSEEWLDIKNRAYLADLADLAYRAYRAYRVYRAYLADLADLAYRAYRAYRAYLAYRADYYTWMRDVLVNILSTSPVPVSA